MQVDIYVWFLFGLNLVILFNIVGEVHMNLEQYYRKAYKRNIAIKLFEKKKGAAAKREAKKDEKVALQIEDVQTDIPPPETEEDIQKAKDEAINKAKEAADAKAKDVATKAIATKTGVSNATAGKSNSNVFLPVCILILYLGAVVKAATYKKAADSDDDEDVGDTKGKGWPKKVAADSDDDEDVGLGITQRNNSKASNAPQKPLLQGKPSSTSPVPEKKTTTPVEKKDGTEKPKSGGWFSWFSSKKPEDEDKKALLEDHDIEEGKDKEAKEKEHDDAELKAFIAQIQGMTGLYDVDPEDSEWLHFEKANHNDPTKPESMGYVAYSLQIWPKDKATVMPVGSAQMEPNNNPYLPPPVGRLKFSWYVI